MTAEAAGAVPDDVIDPVALVLLRQAGEELDDLDQDPDAELFRADAREVIAAFLSVPSVAEVFARDAKVREIVERPRFSARLNADKIACFDAIAALYSEDGTR